ncbi:MAG TPA: redoxin domain-containing protein [Bryobacteraceae bacterium]|nr:redoxin domain-containing protein [Bryobacteraceae bacterium]
MHLPSAPCVFALAVILGAPFLAAQSSSTVAAYKLGHSFHGESFDSGPRQKPWEMQGIGEAHFPITTNNPEVQKWFDQGNALLHSFWFYEAERAFRWCLKLEPDNAMAYWGLARAVEEGPRSSSPEVDRAAEFIREAAKRKGGVSERERLFIEASEAAILRDPLLDKDSEFNYEEHNRRYKKVLETLCLRYPEDVEARALLALANMGSSRYGTELIIREILSRQPDHPGAHHYRIHNWDYHEPEQALESCRKYTELVPGIGHAQHMPGHIYSIVGMWHEAAISMDAATRVEKRYMKESLTFPFNNWNYGHNLNYLSYIQEQLGMARAAIFNSRQLIDAPLDPKHNGDETYSAHSVGIRAMARVLTKYERWDELLDAKTIPWRDIFLDKINKAYFEARAYLGKGDLQKAEKSISEHAALKKDLEKNKDEEEYYEIQAQELKGRYALARGETIEGLGLLAEAAKREFDIQKSYADPPFYPQALYSSLGEAYLDAKSPVLGARAFEKALELTRNDLFALSGLVRAYAALGEKAKAEDAMARLLFLASDADPGLPILQKAKATGITAAPRDSSPAPQRNYVLTSLERFGPNRWEPYEAPKLDVRDAQGKRVTLEDYRGKNVLLIFYLGAECPHCVRQLHDIGAKKTDWERLNTVVLAVSSATPSKNAAAMKEFGDLPVRVLSDDKFDNARRFHSYDDFEDIELHSTILIDTKGRVYWARMGGDPFSDTAFLVKQLERMNEMGSQEAEVRSQKSDSMRALAAR